MKAVFALTVCAAVADRRSSNGKTAIEQAVGMLTDMLAKAKADLQEDKVEFSAFTQFCDTVTVEKQDRIKAADSQIEMLDADLEQYQANLVELKQEIDGHHSDISGWKGDTTSAVEDHAEAKAAYRAEHSDLSESIVACGAALKTLREQEHDRPQAAILLQRVSSLAHTPRSARSAISAFLQERDGVDTWAPEANAYEFQSGSITDLLKDLQDKFTEERAKLEKEFMKNNQAHEMLVLGLTQSIDASKNELKDDVKAVATNNGKVADTKGVLGDTTTGRADDKQYLDDLIAECRIKTDDFAKRQELRADEIASIEKVIDILSGDSVSGSAEKHLPQLLQRGSAFAQLRASQPVQESQSDSRSAAAAFLEGQAETLKSTVLAAIATRVTSGPFDKVKTLISELIDKLEAEAAEEADHKQWCDEELGENEKTRTEKTAEVEKLSAEIDGLQSKISKLGKELAELAQAIADINKAVADATDMRQKENEENEQAIIDAQEGQGAVNEAIELLHAFYNKGNSFLQSSKEASGEAQQQPARNTQAENVLSFLDVIKSDFARLERDATDAESKGQSGYDSFMEESNADKGQKESDVDHRKGEKHDAEMVLGQKSDDLDAAQSQLNAAKAYFDKLRPSCVGSPTEPYEQRVGRRQEEIESLEQTLKILSGEEISGNFFHNGKYQDRS